MITLDNSLVYWIWLTRRKNVGARGAVVLLAHFGSPEEIYRASEKDFQIFRSLHKTALDALLEKDLSESKKILEECAKKDIRILTIADAQYPERLRAIYDPPAVLYYQGQVPEMDKEPTIAIVGPRKCSSHGMICAKHYANRIACSGFIVVSGGARGADTMALNGALAAGRPVACVLGCGVDIAYPKENKQLFAEIARKGWLLSPYPPGTPPEAKNFPPRNRIISGLSLGVLVVEASYKSGALITANCALEQGRDVFAIPANVGLPTTSGSNALIKDGAIVATCPWDVAGEYVERFPDRIQNIDVNQSLRVSEDVVPLQAKKAEAPTQANSDEENTILAVLQTGTLHVDEIVAKSGMPAAKILSSLTMLEIRGLVKRYPGMRFSRA